MIKKCSIMQPHFFPWSGYFNLINKCHTFIFLDDVQFSKNSWQVRNKLFINKSIKWITVPTQKSSLKNTKINEKIIDYRSKWKQKMIKTIMQNYSSFPGSEDINTLMKKFNDDKSINLADLNINLIKFICKKIFINTEMVRSSIFKIEKKRTDKVIEILKLTKSSEYISAIGSKDHLFEDNFKKKINIKLTFNNYQPEDYNNISKKIGDHNLSIIDVIANLGWKETSKYVKE